MNRQMTVTYAPGCKRGYAGDQKPMLRIANRFLLKSGFTVGSKVDVEYKDGIITITLKNTI